MSLPLRGRRGARTAAAVLTAAAVGPLALLIAPTAASAAPATDRTSPTEARRVDRVKAPKIDWFTCTEDGGQCATIRLPLDYDRPNGATTEIALARVKAAKPKQKIGTLFVNPGGPGGSSVQLALAASFFLDQKILDRFDIVGVDPRGIGFGDNVRCFPNLGVQADKMAGYEVPFPVTKAEQRAYIRSSRALAKGCGTTGRPLAASMSTAEVARDMDVVRRTLGEKKLNFLGFSYGTQLGQVYANMFPDRVRAVVIDGVIDPVEWTTGRRGTGRTIPVDDRLKSADGAYLALSELMARCDKAGKPACAFAGSGDSLAKFDTLASRLKKKPLVISDPDFGDFEITYAAVVSEALGALYDPFVGPDLTAFFQDLYTASNPAATAAKRAAAKTRATSRLADLRAARTPQKADVRWPGRGGRAFPYDNSFDSFVSVLCSDSVNPKSPNRWIPTSKAADKRAPYFGSAWNWSSNACADSIWTARDEDRYMGPFTRRTAKPVLVVGNYYDPATSYHFGAVPAAKLLPNSRLLTSDSWGHTAYGTSPCVNDAVAAYLISGALPAKGTVCTGPQPFEDSPAPLSSSRTAGSTARPAPVVPFVPPTFG